MTDTMTVQVDPALRAAIDDLVREGEYESEEQFVNHAILLKFQFDQIPVDGRPIGPNPMDAFFDSPKGREIIREILRER